MDTNILHQLSVKVYCWAVLRDISYCRLQKISEEVLQLSAAHWLETQLLKNAKALSKHRNAIVWFALPATLIENWQGKKNYGTIYHAVNDGLLNGVKEHLRRKWKPYRKRKP